MVRGDKLVELVTKWGRKHRYARKAKDVRNAASGEGMHRGQRRDAVTDGSVLYVFGDVSELTIFIGQNGMMCI